MFLFRCVLHPLPLPLSSCLGCIPSLTGLPSLRFYEVASSLFLLSVCCMFSILSRRCLLLATSLPVLFCLLSMLISDSRFDLVWFRLSCDHGWIRSGSVNVRNQQQQQPAGVTQEEGHTGFLIHLSAVRALIFLARRIQPFLSLVDREVEFCFVVVVVVVFTLKAVPISTQYFLTSVLVQLTRTPSVVTG